MFLGGIELEYWLKMGEIILKFLEAYTYLLSQIHATVILRDKPPWKIVW